MVRSSTGRDSADREMCDVGRWGECLCGSAAFGGGNGSGCRVHGGATRETPNPPDKTIDDDWVPCFLLGGGCSWSDWVMLLVQRFILTCVCVIVLVVLLLVAVLMGCLYYYYNDNTRWMRAVRNLEQSTERARLELDVRSDLRNWDSAHPELHHELMVRYVCGAVVSVVATSFYQSLWRALRTTSSGASDRRSSHNL